MVRSWPSPSNQLRLASDERERTSPGTPEYEAARGLEERLNAVVLETVRRRNRTALADG
jgi:hypothetical protein